MYECMHTIQHTILVEKENNDTTLFEAVDLVCDLQVGGSQQLLS